MLFVHFAMVILFAAAGVYLLSGKAAGRLIPLAAASVPSRYDLPRVMRYLGILLLLLSVSALVMAAHVYFQSAVLLWIGIGLMTVLSVGGTVFLFTSKRFLKKDEK